MIASGYTLDLYCDVRGCDEYDGPAQFFDEVGHRARAAARKKGWKFSWRESLAICPKHAADGVQLRDVRARAEPCVPCATKAAAEGRIGYVCPHGT